ncbi:MAG: S-methyl-5'-thioadenosine phosphorylase [Deltaproteobacteria bacterium]|nr:S-methyl-5'-thioadenosine phosphorylase [Deltaproteobacteria bacterium]MBW2550001.1 S-methyl-5'-thioadenosine phosphorylase [Deltaproteobacteria bacterium]
MSEVQRTLGVIGGSGLYELERLANVEELKMTTPFGAPSDAIIAGTIESTRLLFLPRHGRGHGIAPHKINYRANVLALKMAGAEQILSVSAVGSMQEDIHPGDMIVVDQFIDRTRHRIDTFFDDDGVVAHVEFAEPIDAQLASSLARAANRAGATVHESGVYLCMEGPQFSTRAESQLYRSWGVSVIGMTNLPEARLAREAELPYATLAMATDYDCWHEGHDAVTVSAVIAVMQGNVARAKEIIVELAQNLPDPSGRPATSALAGAIITKPGSISVAARDKLRPLIEKYVS